MHAKSLVGLAAIVASIWIWSTLNKNAFEADAYSLCLGRVGQGPTVTDGERAICACKVEELLGSEPLRARLPNAFLHVPPARLASLGRAPDACLATG